MKRKKIKASDLPELDAAEYLDSEEAVADYLTAVLAGNDPALLAAALGDIARGPLQGASTERSSAIRHGVSCVRRPRCQADCRTGALKHRSCPLVTQTITREGHRYAFMAADALRRAGYREGDTYLDRPGARETGYFPLVFNPGTTVSASFSDSSGRAADALFYFLAREHRNPDFAWFQDRVTPRSLTSEGWPDEALTLVWRPVDESWLPEARTSFRPQIPAVTSFLSIGWATLADVQPDPQRFLAFKSGSLSANHSHLDLNHVSVGVGETMLLVDLGSRSYPTDYFTSARYGYYEITTAGHNSVLVGGKGQSVNKVGQLRGPVEGATFVAFTGVADNAYEVATPRARRHVVFVDRRYYVLLDEIATSRPRPSSSSTCA